MKTIETPRKRAIKMYPPVTLTAAIIPPAMVGPSMRLACIPTESRAIALVNEAFPNRSWTTDLRAGMSRAQPKPVRSTTT